MARAKQIAMKSIAPRLIFCIAICLVAGMIGSIFTSPSIGTWYGTLQKPSFNPPNWAFAPVWTTLYILMGISLYLVWDKGLAKKEVRISIMLFAGQLVLNVLWSILFFGYHLVAYAFMEIIILWIAIASTMILFYRISKYASALLVPYIIWVTVAAVLNYSVYVLNV